MSSLGRKILDRRKNFGEYTEFVLTEIEKDNIPISYGVWLEKKDNGNLLLIGIGAIIAYFLIKK